VSATVRIRIKPYGQQYPFGISEVFKIVEKDGSVLDVAGISRASGSGLIIRDAGGAGIIFSSGKGQLSGVDIFDCAGRLRAAVECNPASNSKSITWNGKDRNGSKLATGWYIANGRGKDFILNRAFVVR
jgi:hypothetical protein